jgi:hypothetical protein
MALAKGSHGQLPMNEDGRWEMENILMAYPVTISDSQTGRKLASYRFFSESFYILT